MWRNILHSAETLWAEAKAQGPGRGPLTLRPERKKNKHTPRRHWSLCRPPRGNGPQGGVRQQESPQTSKFTPPKKISRQIPVKGGIEGDHPRGGNIKAEKKETCCKCSVMQRRLGHECPRGANASLRSEQLWRGRLQGLVRLCLVM